MSKSSYNLIRRYLMHKEVKILNELTELRNLSSYRKIDELDHLEFILALNKIKVFNEIFDELNKVIDYCIDSGE